MNESKPEIAARRAAAEFQARRAVGRVPLYAAALAAVRALEVRGIAPEAVGRDVPWPKEFAPLDKLEKATVVREAAAARARRAHVAAAVAEASAG
jgi:hypothetical protein